MDPYQLLNVTPLANKAEVQSRYEELCEKYPTATHPEERKLVDEAYSEIIKTINQTQHAKISHQEPVPVKEEPEQAPPTLEKDELKERRNKSGRFKLFSMIGGGLVAGVVLSTMAFMYFGEDEPTVLSKDANQSQEASITEESNSTSSVESEEPVDEGPTKEELAAEEKEKQEEAERIKQEELEQKKEEAVEVVNEIGTVFYQDLQNALVDQSARDMSSTTSKFRNDFQPSLNSLKEHGSIFDGEIEMRSVDSSAIQDVTDQKIVVQTTTDYSSRSYNPYLQEEPPGNAITWSLTLVKQGDEWLIDERRLINDEASKVEAPIRDQVKYDLASTLNTHAIDWEQAYEQKDSSFFTQVDSPDYINRQEKYYAVLDKNDRYYEGEFLGLDYSFDSVEVTQGKNVTATIEAKAIYDGAYYDMDSDEMVDVDDTESSVFLYTLWYRDNEWVIINTKELNDFTSGDVRTYSDDGYDEEYTEDSDY